MSQQIMQCYLSQFDASTGQWKTVEPKGGPFPKKQLTVATFNVWFDDFHQVARHKALLDILRSCDADVMGLQEVTPLLLDMILDEPWVQENYFLSDATAMTVDPYGNLLLSRIPPLQCYQMTMPTVMGRSLLVMEFAYGLQKFRIATVHLESYRDSQLYRAKQMDLIFPHLNLADHAILMGDLNFCSSWDEENSLIDPAYSDPWEALHPDHEGFTWDTHVNTMKYELKKEHQQARFDRVFYRSETEVLRPMEMDLLGTEAIGDGKQGVFVSDHFGLKVRFGLNGYV